MRISILMGVSALAAAGNAAAMEMGGFDLDIGAGEEEDMYGWQESMPGEEEALPDPGPMWQGSETVREEYVAPEMAAGEYDPGTQDTYPENDPGPASGDVYGAEKVYGLYEEGTGTAPGRTQVPASVPAPAAMPDSVPSPAPVPVPSLTPDPAPSPTPVPVPSPTPSSGPSPVQALSGMPRPSSASLPAETPAPLPENADPPGADDPLLFYREEKESGSSVQLYSFRRKVNGKGLSAVKIKAEAAVHILSLRVDGREQRWHFEGDEIVLEEPSGGDTCVLELLAVTEKSAQIRLETVN